MKKTVFLIVFISLFFGGSLCEAYGMPGDRVLNKSSIGVFYLNCSEILKIFLHSKDNKSNPKDVNIFMTRIVEKLESAGLEQFINQFKPLLNTDIFFPDGELWVSIYDYSGFGFCLNGKFDPKRLFAFLVPHLSTFGVGVKILQNDKNGIAVAFAASLNKPVLRITPEKISFTPTFEKQSQLVLHNSVKKFRNMVVKSRPISALKGNINQWNVANAIQKSQQEHRICFVTLTRFEKSPKRLSSENSSGSSKKDSLFEENPLLEADDIILPDDLDSLGEENKTKEDKLECEDSRCPVTGKKYVERENKLGYRCLKHGHKDNNSKNEFCEFLDSKLVDYGEVNFAITAKQAMANLYVKNNEKLNWFYKFMQKYADSRRGIGKNTPQSKEPDNASISTFLSSLKVENRGKSLNLSCFFNDEREMASECLRFISYLSQQMVSVFAQKKVEAWKKACYSKRMILMTGVEMYNLDNPERMGKLDIDIMRQKNYVPDGLGCSCKNGGVYNFYYSDDGKVHIDCSKCSSGTK